MQKDLEFELAEDLKQFDSEEFQKNDFLSQVDGLSLNKITVPDEYKRQATSEAFNQSLVLLLEFNTVQSLDGHIVAGDD